VALTLVTTHGLAVVRACHVAGLSRAADDTPPADRTEQDAAVSLRGPPWPPSGRGGASGRA
jgi:hypothetical protein